MPKYRITLSDGRTFEVEASAQPSEADVMAQLGDGSSPSTPEPSPKAPSRAGYYQGVVEQAPRVARAVVNALPAIGGTIGGVFGSVPGAAAGGAAGQGFRSLLQNASELPGAARDVARNMAEHPIETAQGAVGGMNRGGVDAGAQAATNAAGQKLGQVVGDKIVQGAKAGGAWLMQSALKPAQKATLGAIKQGQVPAVVRTLLDEGVNVTPGGIEKLNGIIGASNAEIKAALGSIPANQSISPLAVAGRLSPMARQAAKQVNPADDLATISNTGQEFLGAHGAQNLTPQAAQEMKSATYRALSDKAYGEIKGTAIEGQKALARGLKEEIEREAAAAGIDIGALNAREGAAITARDAIAKRVAMVGNRDPAGLAWLAHSPTTFIMALAERSPVVKTLLARGLWTSASKASGMPVDALKYAMGAIASRTYQEGQE